MMKKALVIELWGLGDAVLATPALAGLSGLGCAVTLLCRAASRELLEPSYPEVDYRVLQVPWTAFRGKYRFQHWPWKELRQVLGGLRQEEYDAGLSVRRDPRDHLLLWLAGVRRRVGFPRGLSRCFLNVPVASAGPRRHRVEEWWRLLATVDSGPPAVPPQLKGSAYPWPGRLAPASAPYVVVHCGAGHAVRRWPEPHFRAVMQRLRRRLAAEIWLMPDPDGYGESLSGGADRTVRGLGIRELAAVLGGARWVLANDSGPGHIAAALGTPVLSVFGPQDPAWFRPFGSEHHAVARDLCPHRPCFDACRFAEPYCLTRLHPDEVWPEIERHIQSLVLRGGLAAVAP